MLTANAAPDIGLFFVYVFISNDALPIAWAKSLCVGADDVIAHLVEPHPRPQTPRANQSRARLEYDFISDSALITNSNTNTAARWSCVPFAQSAENIKRFEIHCSHGLFSPVFVTPQNFHLRTSAMRISTAKPPRQRAKGQVFPRKDKIHYLLDLYYLFN
ncbi:hypothetical protein NUW58_g7584 [Xylaria curta]|uniref:Uncharacterized protein n=1 Tax=Xylaria curta TaxID=42375 RepID=A0ACC1NFS3_9PEZI|nr:hypothetical protein NUW58_g7584 [Xylaria curta]